jgi:PAS domain S-box-containing protein
LESLAGESPAHASRLLSLADLGPVVAYHDRLGEVFFALDSQWRLALANEAALRLARTTSEAIGRSYWDVVPHARGSALEDAFRRALATAEPAELEIASRFDPERYSRIVVLPLADGLAVSFRDISKHRAFEIASERRLLKSEEHLRLAAEAAEIGTWDVDPQSGARHWSAHFRAILGLPDDAAPNPGLFSSLIHPEDRARIEELYRNAYAGLDEGRYAAEFRIVRARDGAERWVSTRGRVFFGGDGRAIRGIGAIIDVTGRKRAERALQESEERFRLAAEAFQGGVFELDAGTGRVVRSDRHYELVGEAPGSIQPDRHAWYVRIHPQDRPAFDDAIRPVYEGDALQYEAEYRVRHRDGRWVWIWHRALALRDAEGRLRRVIGSLIDITGRKEAEERQQLLIDELNHRVKNSLATVQSIAAQTLRDAASTHQARHDLEQRLIALARAHDVLTRENWAGADLAEIVVRAIQPFERETAPRFAIAGAPVRLSPRSALAFSMALQELATNAVKYGALSVETGTVEVSWTLAGSGAPRLEFRWQERGGPPVAPPRRRGFGSRLIEKGLAHDLNGDVTLSFDPDGVVCRLWAPVE